MYVYKREKYAYLILLEQGGAKDGSRVRVRANQDRREELHGGRDAARLLDSPRGRTEAVHLRVGREVRQPCAAGWPRQGPSLNDVTQIFHIFGPPLKLSHSRKLSVLFSASPSLLSA